MFQGGCNERGMWSILLYNFINMWCEGQRNKMTKKHYYYYCFQTQSTCRRGSCPFCASTHNYTTRQPPTILNHSPLTMIGRQIGATEKIDKLFSRSSPKEFTKLFYDHCCVLPNHIPRRSLFMSITLHAKWTRACYILLMMEMVETCKKLKVTTIGC